MNLTEDNILLGIDGGNWVFTHRQKTKRRLKFVFEICYRLFFCFGIINLAPSLIMIASRAA